MAPAPESPLSRLLRGEQLRRAAVNSGWLMTDRLLRMVLGLFVVVLVARHLGPSDYGVLTYADAGGGSHKIANHQTVEIGERFQRQFGQILALDVAVERAPTSCATTCTTGWKPTTAWPRC